MEEKPSLLRVSFNSPNGTLRQPTHSHSHPFVCKSIDVFIENNNNNEVIYRRKKK